MPLIPPTGKDFEIVEAGVHKGRCIKVIDLGTQETSYKGQIQHKHKVMIMFELPETKMTEDPNEGKPFAVALFVTLSLDKKSNLRPLLVGWRGKDFTEEEAGNFDILKLLDQPVLINVIHNESDGNIYANISSLMPLKASNCPPRINPLVSFNIAEFDQSTFDGLSEKMQDKIKQTPEYRAFCNPDIPSMTDEEVDNTFGNQDVDEEEPAPF